MHKLQITAQTALAGILDIVARTVAEYFIEYYSHHFKFAAQMAYGKGGKIVLSRCTNAPPRRNLNKEDPATSDYLVEALGRRHRCLDGQATDILPPLLQQGHEVVDSQHDVGDQLVLGHTDVSNSDTHAQHLLQLELDRGLDFVDLAAQVFIVGDGCREFTGY